jgi:broad specificity phosphatase PhoE
MTYYHSQTPGDMRATWEATAEVPQGKLLLTRHSIRPPFPPGVYHMQVDITPEGVQLAEALGERFGSALARLQSSTSKRCLQTAEAMARGAKTAATVEVNPLLGDRGAFVADSDRTHEVMVEQGPLGLVNACLQDQPDCGLHPSRASLRQLLRSLFGAGIPEGAVWAAISHDTVLGVVVGMLQGKTELTVEEWPQMLEGVVLWQEDDQLACCWRGERWSVPKRDGF